jgi:acylphosphatase
MSERPESATTTVALHAIVRGRVQGVNFRDFVYRRAISLGLAGYVRNLPDMRSLEVVAEGQRERLERLVEHLREGPGRAWVDSVDVRWREASRQYTQFRVTL